MTYWRLHYHLIWATFERQPDITPDRERLLYGVIYQKGKELEIKIKAIGNTEDHVHVLVSIPPKLSISNCVRHLKGASAYALNRMGEKDGHFKWQEGYGALSISESALKTVTEYVLQQKEHHKENSAMKVYEKMDEN